VRVSILVHESLLGVRVADALPIELARAAARAAGLDADAEDGPVAVTLDARFPRIDARTLRALAEGTATVALTPDGAPAAWRGERVDRSRPVTLDAASSARLDDPRGRHHIEREAVRDRAWALIDAGVWVADPERVWIGPNVAVAAGARLWADVVLRGATRVAAGAEIGQGSVLEDTTVGEGSRIKPYTVCSGATIGDVCQVGPFTHLRPGARLERDVKVGNFVEVKSATLHDGVRASHLSYLGDAEVGARTNVGAGTITCNYDGFRKHRTTIGEDVFVGSNTCLVAPVSVGDGVVIGALSCITQDVPADALAVERAPLRVLAGRGRSVRDRNRRAAGK
jgi:UDP-N-acetylglucosamine diphosphorylase/glucosamine-1-phosphate N-acetyltransferase